MKEQCIEAQDVKLRSFTDGLVALESRFAEAAVNVNKELHHGFLTVLAAVGGCYRMA